MSPTVRPRPRFVLLAVLALLLLTTSLATRVAARPAESASSAGSPSATGTARWGTIIGDYVVYSGDFTTPGRFDLYSAPIDGGMPIRLSSGLPDGEVIEYAGAGDRVVFSWLSDGRYGLYSARLAGSLPTRLHPEYTDENAGSKLAFVVAGSRVVFAVDQERRDVGVLYSVEAAGGDLVRLSLELPDPTPTIAWTVSQVFVSDDNSTVAYTLALTGNDQFLYTVPVAGGDSTQINASGEALTNQPGSIALTPDGSRVVYTSPTLLGGGGAGVNLVSVAADGSDRQELDSDAQIRFKLTSDGARAVYFRSSDPFGQTGELRSVPLGGGASTQLSANATTGFALEPAQGTVFFAPVGGGLQRIPVAGGSTQDVLQQGFPNLDSLRFSASGYAVFSASDGAATRIYSYPLSGGQALPIDDPAVSTGFLGDFLLSSERAIYFAMTAGGAPPQLYSVPLSGGESVKLTGAYEGTENFVSALSANSSLLLYGVGERVSGQPLLFTRLLLVPVDGSAEPRLVNTEPAEPGPDRVELHLPLLHN